jgi:hypothetical protein
MHTRMHPPLPPCFCFFFSFFLASPGFGAMSKQRQTQAQKTKEPMARANEAKKQKRTPTSDAPQPVCASSGRQQDGRRALPTARSWVRKKRGHWFVLGPRSRGATQIYHLKPR